MIPIRRCLTLIALGAATSCTGADAAWRDRQPDAEWLHQAMSHLTDVIVYDIFSPPQASRAYAYASIAGYEALRHDDTSYRSPLPFDMTEGSPFQRQVKEVYDLGRQLTDGQRASVAFWDDNPYVMHVRGHAMFATKKMTPGGHWMGIAAIAARTSNADLIRSAETYARTAVALADGFIACWEEKYRSNLARPETLINAHLDERWTPLLQTPPFPEYTSGHSVISTAAATVLADLYGSDFAFEDDTEVAYGLPTRSFASFHEAAAEAAMSRLYGGIHYRMAVEEGVAQGRRVGELVTRRLSARGANPAEIALPVASAGR